eukprot:Opistho-2@5265
MWSCAIGSISSKIREKERTSLFREGNMLVSRMGDLIAENSRNNIRRYLERGWSTLHENGVAGGRIRAQDAALNRFHRKLTLDPFDVIAPLCLSEDNLEMDFRIPATQGPAESSAWRVVRATDGPWVVRENSKPLMLEMLTVARRTMETVTSGFVAGKLLPRIVDAVHPSSSSPLHPRVMSQPTGFMETIERQLRSLGYHVTPSLAETGDRLESRTTCLDVIGQLEGSLLRTMRYYFEIDAQENKGLSSLPRATWAVGFTIDAGHLPERFPGSDKLSFGFISDGTIWHNKKQYKYTDAFPQRCTIGVVVDMYFGYAALSINGTELVAAFGAGAVAFDVREQDRQSELLKASHVLPVFAINGAIVSGNAPVTDRRKSYRPMDETNTPASMDAGVSQLSLRVNFGASFKFFPKDASASIRIPSIASADTARVGEYQRRAKEVISVPNAKEEMAAELSAQGATTRKQQYMNSLQFQRQRCFSSFPRAVHRRVAAAFRIQRAWRRYKGRQLLRKMKETQNRAARIIQRNVRAILPKILKKKNNAALVIQRNWRRVVAMRLLKICKKYRRALHQLDLKAKVIQRAFRTYLAINNSPVKKAQRIRQRQMENASIRIQRWIRPILARRREAFYLSKRVEAAIVIQSVYRGHLLRRLLRPDLRDRLKALGISIARRRRDLLRHKAAYVLQRSWRRYMCVKVYRLKSETARKAATRIQSAWRGYYWRLHLHRNFEYGQYLFLEAFAKRLRDVHFITNRFRPTFLVCPK